MKSKYYDAIEFIALNDAPADTIGLNKVEAKEFILGLVTVALVSELFGTTAKKIAKDVYDVRSKFFKEYLK